MRIKSIDFTLDRTLVRRDCLRIQANAEERSDTQVVQPDMPAQSS
jgi:hypothetical protein